MNYYEHHLGDYAQATAHLSMLEDAAYSRMLRWYYAEERPLPADIKQVCRIVRASSPAEREAVEVVLREFFELQADGYHQRRADAEIARYTDKRSKAKRSADARWKNAPKHTERNADGMPSECERICERNADGMLPISNLQSPIPPYPPEPDSVVANGKHAALPGDVERVFDHWRVEWGHPSAQLDAKRRKVIRDGLKSYTTEQLCTAISGYRKSPHHTGTNDRKTVYDALTLLLRDNEHIDAGIKFATQREQTTWM